MILNVKYASTIKKDFYVIEWVIADMFSVRFRASRTTNLVKMFREPSGKSRLGVPFWLLFFPNSRWRHKSYMSKWGLRRTNITARYWAACKWRRFLEIWSTSVSKDRDLLVPGPTRLLFGCTTVHRTLIKNTGYDEWHSILSKTRMLVSNSTTGYKW